MKPFEGTLTKELKDEIENGSLSIQSSYYLAGMFLECLARTKAKHGKINMFKLEPFLAEEFLEVTGIKATFQFCDFGFDEGPPPTLLSKSVTMTFLVPAKVEYITVSYSIS